METRVEHNTYESNSKFNQFTDLTPELTRLHQKIEEQIRLQKHKNLETEMLIREKITSLLKAMQLCKQDNKKENLDIFKRAHQGILDLHHSLQGYGAPNKEWYGVTVLMLIFAATAAAVVFPPGMIAASSLPGTIILVMGGISLATAAVGTFFANAHCGASKTLSEIANEALREVQP